MPESIASLFAGPTAPARPRRASRGVPGKTPKRPPWTPPADIPRCLVDPPPSVAGRDLDHRSAMAVQNAWRILTAAVDYFRPVRIYACFSGGYDSVVPVAFAMGHARGDARGRWFRDIPIEVLHVNTGIGIEATRQYVRDTCAAEEWPLREVRTPESYEDLVLGKVDGYPGGFPGPAMHATMYQRLKERAIRVAVREAKVGRPRSSTVLLLSGIRADESRVRTGYARAASKVDSQVWLNPFYWAAHDVFTDYRTWRWMPKNPVKEGLGMSGECLCGAYAEKGELERVGWVCPATKAYIEDLERRVAAAGFPWGWEDPGPPKGRRARGEFADQGFHSPGDDDHRPMCHNCDKVHGVKASAGTQGTLF